MNFKKINKPTNTGEDDKNFTVDDLKMVKVTFTFPAWKTASFQDICSEFADADLTAHENAVVEESSVNLSELKSWNDEYTKIAGNSWYLYHRNIDVSVDDIVENGKKPKPKKK
jgi:hypothetical protein